MIKKLILPIIGIAAIVSLTMLFGTDMISAGDITLFFDPINPGGS